LGILWVARQFAQCRPARSVAITNCVGNRSLLHLQQIGSKVSP